MAEVAEEQRAIAVSERLSVREFMPGVWGGIIGDSFSFTFGIPQNLLPPWGTVECDIALRMMHYAQHNSIWSFGVNIFIEKFLSTPYEISGGRNLTYQWSDLFQRAEFGEGYDAVMTPAIVDYVSLNRGMFFELVSYGDPSEPIRDGAEIVGINHLDALRLQFTGNREIPYIYTSEYTNTRHKMHASRVIRIAHQPSPNTQWYGMGKSSLYDALSVVNSQILLGRHQNELLSDTPPSGIVIFNNVKADEIDRAVQQFESDRRRDGQSTYRAPLTLSSKDPSQPATVSFTPLSTVPEGFDYEKYTQVHVNVIAGALGLDPQDIWPLTGQALGSGAQSRVLAAKTQVKGPGYLLNLWERAANIRILPRSLEWKFKAQNAEQDLETANIATLWTEIANKAQFLDQEEKRQLVANQVPAFADVLLDEQGNVRLPDDDEKQPGNEGVIADDATELDTPVSGTPDVQADSQTETGDGSTPPETDYEAAAEKAHHKAIDDTTSEFVSEVQAAMQDGLDRVVTKASTAARIRGAIQRYGKLAYQDGLEDGGVDDSELDEDDTRIIADLNVTDSVYVSDLVNEIYSEAGMSGTPESRAPMWGNKTLQAFYYAGIESADKNGMYEFTGDDGKESCADCTRLKGVTHRMKWWVDNEMRPGIDTDNFECGGWRCQHYLEKKSK